MVDPLCFFLPLSSLQKDPILPGQKEEKDFLEFKVEILTVEFWKTHSKA
jgi:hypothetical protein